MTGFSLTGVNTLQCCFLLDQKHLASSEIKYGFEINHPKVVLKYLSPVGFPKIF